MSRPCAQCGYDYDSLTRDEIPPTIRTLGPAFAGVLKDHPAVELRAHPLPGSWSVLEYCCHFRDVLTIQRQRIELTQGRQQPSFASMRRDERAIEESYNEQLPDQVGQALQGAAGALAHQLEGLDGPGWQRTGLYHWPQTAVRTVEWIGRHTVHEGRHHLWDLERLLGTLDRAQRSGE